MSALSTRRQRGQILVVLALTLVVVLGMLSLAIDGSYGFIQERQDQKGLSS